MNNLQTLTLSKKKYTFNILDSIEAEITILENPYELPIEELFTMAARINKKRSFLFVSKVLGKHLPIDPKKGLLAAALLAARFVESVKGMECPEKDSLLFSFLQGGSFESRLFIPEKENPVVIGFAETATALGHAFFDCFQKADYFHTTREELVDQKPGITFEEEHSHATSHRCYIPLELLRNNREVILVDDEMTTGKTALNIIRSIHAEYPRAEYTVVSILDWRSKANKGEFSKLEHSLGIKINVVSLLAGEVNVNQLMELEKKAEVDFMMDKPEVSVEKLQLAPFFSSAGFFSANGVTDVPFIEETGRFGISSIENMSLQKKAAEAALLLKENRSGERTLCLGTGEFMYLPMKLAAMMGEGVFYQSTTRSPIYVENKLGYGARYGGAFPNPEDHHVSHFVYNIPPGFYDEIFLFFEREVDLENIQPFLKVLAPLRIPSVKLVYFSKT